MASQNSNLDILDTVGSWLCVFLADTRSWFEPVLGLYIFGGKHSGA